MAALAALMVGMLGYAWRGLEQRVLILEAKAAEAEVHGANLSGEDRLHLQRLDTIEGHILRMERKLDRALAE